MINPNELHRWHEQFTFNATTEVPNFTGTLSGVLMVEYEVRSYTDLRNNEAVDAYLVECTPRLIVPNQSASSAFASAAEQATSYENYLGAFSNSVYPFSTTAPTEGPWTPPAIAPPVLSSCFLLDYFPKTINTAIVASSNASDASGGGGSQTISHSSGSSVSQTNSFMVSASLGMQGLDFLPSASVSFGSSDTRESSQEAGSDRSVSQSHSSQAGSNVSMSIKDWAAYAMVDSNNQIPTWLWAQEHPWNIVQVNGGFIATPPQTSGSQNSVSTTTVTLPHSVSQLLLMPNNGSPVLMPPSQLSLFGVNFFAKSTWYLESSIGADEEYVAFSHTVSGHLASHSLNGSTISATISARYTCDLISNAPIPLRILALSPISRPGPGNGAVVGFVPGQFIYEPDVTGRFRIKSPANNLYVTGDGFQPEASPTAATAPSSPDEVLSTSATFGATSPASITVSFKVLSKDQEYMLILKHWKTGVQGVQLSISINGASPLTRHVDSGVSANGDDNITMISLCNRDLSSGQYFDYLKLGLNTIQITVLPSSDASQGGCGYALRALAIA